MNEDSLPNDTLHKEIDLIQLCISNMTHNSFLLKGWLITLIVAVIALLPKELKIDIKGLCIIGSIMTLCFWYLDAYFLKQERLFRWKYDWVIQNRLKGITDYLYDLSPTNSHMWLSDEKGKLKKEPYIIRIMFTKSLTPFYGLIYILFILLFTGVLNGKLY